MTPAQWFKAALLQAVLAVGCLYEPNGASSLNDGRRFADAVMTCLMQAGFLRSCSLEGVEALVGSPNGNLADGSDCSLTTTCDYDARSSPWLNDQGDERGSWQQYSMAAVGHGEPNDTRREGVLAFLGLTGRWSYIANQKGVSHCLHGPWGTAADSSGNATLTT